MLPAVSTKHVKGLKYCIFDLEELISDQLLSKGSWNGENCYLASLVIGQIIETKKSGTLLDIGSGFGTFSIPLAKQFPLNLKVVAFEPQRPIFYQLCSNILLNSLSNYFAKNVAVSSKNKVELKHCLNVNRSCNHGSFSLIEEINDVRNITKFEDDPLENIDFKTIDANFDSDDLIFVKISVCGMESEVLSGMKNNILKNNNPPIIIESWKTDFNLDTYEKCMSQLKDFGYFAYVENNDFIFAVAENDQEFLKFFEKEAIKF